MSRAQATAAVSVPQGKRSAEVREHAKGRALPLEDIGELTSEFREAIARTHDAESARRESFAGQAWDAIGRHGGKYAVVQGPLAGKKRRLFALERQREVATDPRRVAFLEAELRAERGRLVTRDSPTHVKRIRRRAKDWRDRKGRARRSIEKVTTYVPSHEAHAAAARWHEGRSKGQRHRLPSVAACGTGTITVTCSSCGVVHESHVFCGVVRLCHACNVRRSVRMRARFAKSLVVVSKNAAASGSFDRYRTGGALSEHHLVLTLPHVTEEPVETPRGAWGWIRDERVGAARKASTMRRITTLFDAWRDFSIDLQRFMRSPWPGLDLEHVGAAWYRAFEWTPSDGPTGDGMGHPHFHVWLLSPWIPEYDDHKIASIGDKGRRASTRCEVQGSKKGSKKLCPLCRAGVPRRTGLRTWWAQALERHGVKIASTAVNVTMRQAYVAPRELIAEVQKTAGGVSYTRRVVERLEIRSRATGELVDYFEGWTIDTIDRATLELCGPEVIAGVYEALEGKRLSQASRVTLKRRDGSTVKVGFLGIADSFYDASCGDCTAVSRAIGEDPTFGGRSVDIVSWDRLASRDWSQSPQSELVEARGPPLLRADPASIEALVKRLLVQERLERIGPARAMSNLFDACDGMRTREYFDRRGRPSKTSTGWTFRERMRYAAKLRRQGKANVKGSKR